MFCMLSKASSIMLKTSGSSLLTTSIGRRSTIFPGTPTTAVKFFPESGGSDACPVAVGRLVEVPECFEEWPEDAVGGSPSDLLDGGGDAVEWDLVEGRLEGYPEDLVTYPEDCRVWISPDCGTDTGVCSGFEVENGPDVGVGGA